VHTTTRELEQWFFTQGGANGTGRFHRGFRQILDLLKRAGLSDINLDKVEREAGRLVEQIMEMRKIAFQAGAFWWCPL